ncbi:MAG: type III-A CRISPR-associated RAMP protein Csm4 [Thermoanaerobacteraceae bacterium]|nr:type III-A CRISPR-associated RAMP protein Csm4 [Thermoanaerobacteraceae bacterium]
MKAKIVKMEFIAPLHLGSREAVQENTLDHIPSDVIFSAFCTVYRSVYGKGALETFLARQLEEPVLKLSSGFPYYRDTYFLPRPLNLDLTAFGFEPKKARRVRYIDHELFCSALENSLKAASFQDYLEEPARGILLPAKYKGVEIIREVEVPRVALDSITSGSNIYYFNQLVMADEAGFYCLVSCDDELWPRVNTCFRVLGDEGIGGDRSSGKGAFRVDFPGEMVFPDISSPENYVLLSCYYPTSQEARNLDAEYQLMIRSGYMYSPDETALRRKTVIMLAEGAVVYNSSPPQGCLVDVTPPGFNLHRVWRNGYAFSVASSLGKGERRL